MLILHEELFKKFERVEDIDESFFILKSKYSSLIIFSAISLILDIPLIFFSSLSHLSRSIHILMRVCSGQLTNLYYFLYLVAVERM